MRSSGVITGIVIILSIGLAGADYVFKEQYRPLSMPDEVAMPTNTAPATNTGVTASGTGTESISTVAVQMPTTSASSSAPTFVKKGLSMKKKSSVRVDDVIQKLGLSSVQTSERSLLSIAVTTVPVQTSVVLLRGDRALLLSWIESDDVKDIMTNLKKSLQDQFSVQVSDLLDETRQVPNGPPMDVLRFLDPAISSEEIYILRVRNRLYEIHVAKNGADVLGQLMEELGK